MSRTIVALFVLTAAVAGYAMAEEAVSNDPAAAPQAAVAMESTAPAVPAVESTEVIDKGEEAEEAEEGGEGPQIMIPGVPAAPLPADSPLKTLQQKASYIIGLDWGRKIKQEGINVDPELVMRGFADALSGGAPLMDNRQIQEAWTEFIREHEAKQQAERAAAGEKNLKEGDAFLAANAKRPGVKTLPSGLQYEVLAEGQGETPKLTDTVIMNYRGTFVDGKEFDNSAKGGEPATMAMTNLIPGMAEGLQLMKVGSKWTLFLPAKLAYGDTGGGGVIPPNAVLIFEVELLGIEKSGASGPPPMAPPAGQPQK